MIDYKAIADADPGGDLQIAFDAMKAEAVDVLRDVESRMMSARTVYGLIGDVSGKAAMDAIKTSLTDSDVKSWFSPDQGGVDSFLVGPTFDGLAAGGVITQAEADLVKSYAYTKTPKYPSLRMGHLQDARRKRAAGEI
jgi:hypothetical protein